eukprot:7995983-Pyramimonas_sp.AAC.1
MSTREVASAEGITPEDIAAALAAGSAAGSGEQGIAQQADSAAGSGAAGAAGTSQEARAVDGGAVGELTQDELLDGYAAVHFVQEKWERLTTQAPFLRMLIRWLVQVLPLMLPDDFSRDIDFLEVMTGSGRLSDECMDIGNAVNYDQNFGKDYQLETNDGYHNLIRLALRVRPNGVAWISPPTD